jgi:uncharacterized protein YcbK (DUF882 family)
LKLSEHFSLEEANCSDGSPVPSEYLANAMQQAKNLEVLRFAIGGMPIHVNSWYRSKKYNDSLPGASPNSEHLRARASDIWVTGVQPLTLYMIIEALIRLGQMEQGGLGLYKTFVHYDCRGTLKRWNLE